MKLFCNHEYEFTEHTYRSIYFLGVFHSHDIHYSVYTCAKCGKRKKFKISWKEYHKNK